MAFVQALRGTTLTDADRKSLDADHLFLLALQGVIELFSKEKQKLSADHLFILAVRRQLPVFFSDNYVFQ